MHLLQLRLLRTFITLVSKSQVENNAQYLALSKFRYLALCKRFTCFYANTGLTY